MAADLISLKNAVDLVAMQAREHPGWEGMSIYAQSCYRYLLGDLQGALDTVLRGLALSRPCQSTVWGLLAGQHVKLLRELGRTEEALGCGQLYVEIVSAEELSTAQRFVYSEVARTLAVAGRHAEAVAMIDPLIQFIESSGSKGLALGAYYETRARIAIAMQDRAGCEHYLELCAAEYKRGGNNPAITAKFARLMEHAQQHGMASATAGVEGTLPVLSEPAPDDEGGENTIVSRILECVDTSDRARCGLTMLLQSTDAYLGYLYGANEGGLVALAGLPDSAAEPALEQWLGRWLNAERELAAQATVTTATISVEPPATEVITVTADQEPLDARSGASAEYVDAEGRRFHAFMLLRDQAGQRTIAGVLAVQSEIKRRRPPASLLAQIADQLLAHRDVQGVSLGEAPIAALP